ncbi:MAG TPA: ribosome maturation factor RimP [Micavibrio sp.]|nr:ribosome maturation factor RimP [Micavibrio sp.]
MKNTPLEHKLIRIAEPVIKDMGFNLVLLEFKSGILQILAEDPKTGNLSLDDCTAINKMLGPLLEVEDPIPGAYTLEISSPGIDRPLMNGEDFAKYAGYDAKVELDESMEGQRRFRGKILEVKDEFVTFLVDKVEHRLEIAAMKKARLVLTDELIKATRMDREILKEKTN